MFVRAKKSGRYEYLQVVHNERVDGRVPLIVRPLSRASRTNSKVQTRPWWATRGTASS